MRIYPSALIAGHWALEIRRSKTPLELSEIHVVLKAFRKLPLMIINQALSHFQNFIPWRVAARAPDVPNTTVREQFGEEMRARA